eukprot:m.316906 g.316906  ORF g.316906 m.316906 type:complete len:108 (+) comp23077_c1_seq21:456-779(+)
MTSHLAEFLSALHTMPRSCTLYPVSAAADMLGAAFPDKSIVETDNGFLVATSVVKTINGEEVSCLCCVEHIPGNFFEIEVGGQTVRYVQMQLAGKNSAAGVPLEGDP